MTHTLERQPTSDSAWIRDLYEYYDELVHGGDPTDAARLAERAAKQGIRLIHFPDACLMCKRRVRF